MDVNSKGILKSSIQLQPKKLAIYLRVSTDEQNDNTSKPAQLESINKYIANEGWSDIPFEIYDETQSASIISKNITSNNAVNSIDILNISNFLRDELRRLIYNATLKNFDKLIVYSHDRLARNNYEALLIRHTLNKLGIDIIYTKPGEQIKSDNDSMNVFFENLLSNLATLESSIISGRVYLGNKANITHNIWAGGPPPYGYNLIPSPQNVKKSILSVDDSKAIVVKNIFNLYNLGYTPEHIADYVKTNYPNHNTDIRWTKNTIKSILSNPTYLGAIVWNKKGGARNPRKKSSDEYIYSTANDKLKIIDKTTWDKAIYIKQLQKHNPKLISTPFLLQGLAVCGECNTPLRCKNQGKSLNSIYYCNHKTSKFKSADVHNIKCEATQLHNTVINEISTFIKTHIHDTASLQEIYDKYTIAFKHNLNELSIQANTLSESISMIDTTLDKCIKQIEALTHIVESCNDSDKNKEYETIIKCLNEFKIISTINKEQLSNNLSNIKLKLQVKPNSYEEFKDNIFNNFNDFNKIITIKDDVLRNRCIRLLFINLFDHVIVNNDTSPLVSFK